MSWPKMAAMLPRGRWVNICRLGSLPAFLSCKCNVISICIVTMGVVKQSEYERSGMVELINIRIILLYYHEILRVLLEWYVNNQGKRFVSSWDISILTWWCYNMEMLSALMTFVWKHDDISLHNLKTNSYVASDLRCHDMYHYFITNTFKNSKRVRFLWPWLSVLTHKQLETHRFLLSTVATDELVLKNQVISTHHADKIFIVLHCPSIISCRNSSFIVNNIWEKNDCCLMVKYQEKIDFVLT